MNYLLFLIFLFFCLLQYDSDNVFCSILTIVRTKLPKCVWQSVEFWQFVWFENPMMNISVEMSVLIISISTTSSFWKYWHWKLCIWLFPFWKFPFWQFPVWQFMSWQFPFLQIIFYDNFPFWQFPVGQFPVGQFPVRQFPVGQFPEGQLPDGRFQVWQFSLCQFPFWQVSLLIVSFSDKLWFWKM